MITLETETVILSKRELLRQIVPNARDYRG